jgi:NAD+ diphosphatase
MLSRWAVDRGAEHRSDPAWLDAVWDDRRTRVMVVGEGRVAMSGDAVAWWSPHDAGLPDGERFVLGVDGDVALMAVRVDMRPDDSGTLREVAPLLSDRDAGLAVEAIALANWHATHGHCPRCGALTVVDEAGWSRRCPQDQSMHYPRTDPAVIMLVVDPDDRCLLGHAPAWPDGRFSTLAGFVEPGETPERAVAREVAEEVGVTVDHCRYAGSQPWPFPSSLMLGYYASARAQEPRPDGTEITEARWFSRGDFKAAIDSGDVIVPSSISIASLLVEGWYGQPLPSAAPFRDR